MFKAGGIADGTYTDFVRMDKVTSAKLVWHLRNKELIFRICKNGENGKYSLRSYRLYKRNGKDRLFLWKAYMRSEKSLSVEAEAATFEELMALIDTGYASSGIDYNYPLRVLCDYMLGEELETEHPEGSKYFFYYTDKASRFGKGIEQEFAAYWFNLIREKGEK